MDVSFWLDIMTVMTFILAVRQSRRERDSDGPYDKAHDEFETSGVSAGKITKSRAMMEQFHNKNKIICLLITGEASAAHYQVLLINGSEKELTLIEHSSTKPMDSKQTNEICAVLKSLWVVIRPCDQACSEECSESSC